MELVECHLVGEQLPAELGLVVNEGNLGDLLVGLGLLLGEDLLDLVLGVAELLEELGGNGEEVTAGKSLDLASVTERGTHDDGLVSVLLVVGVDAADGLDSWVGLGGVLLSSVLLVPVEDTADEGGDEGDLGLGGSNSLGKAEEEGEVAVDTLLLEDLGGLDTLPGGGDLDEDTVLVNANVLVELDEVASLGEGALSVERVLGVYLGRDTAGDNGEDLLAELDEEAVKSGVGLGVDITVLLLAVLDSNVNELGVGGELGGSEDEGGVSGCVLGLVGGDGLKVTRVRDDNGAGAVGASMESSRASGASASDGVAWKRYARVCGRVRSQEKEAKRKKIMNV